MKTKPLLFLSAVLIVAATLAEANQSYGNLGVSVRRHSEHSEFDDLPFGKRDHSIGISYELHESVAFWQIGVSYTPNLSVKKDAVEAPDYAWTPELNLIAKDRMYHAGLGIASTYTKTPDEGGEWTSVYWQFLLGLQLDLSRRIALSGYGYYPFRNWGDLSDFSFDDIEYGIRLGYRF